MLERWEHSRANYQPTPPLIQHFALSERLVLTLDYGRGRSRICFTVFCSNYRLFELKYVEFL